MLSLLSATPALRVPAPVMQLQTGVGTVGVSTSMAGGVVPTKSVADSSILVQGGSLRTWSYRSPSVEQVQVVLSTEGRPLDADIELWHGPDNTPCKMRVYAERPFAHQCPHQCPSMPIDAHRCPSIHACVPTRRVSFVCKLSAPPLLSLSPPAHSYLLPYSHRYVENGQLRPFSAVIETPRGPNTVAIRNIGQIEFPIAANVVADNVDCPSADALSSSMTIQGGALRTYPFDPSVDSVQVLLKTDGRPLNARIELLQGPNNNKQVIELYTEDGCDRPFFCLLETPGSGNVVRIVNTAPVEFPMTASVVPHAINTEMSANAVLGGDVVISGM